MRTTIASLLLAVRVRRAHSSVLCTSTDSDTDCDGGDGNDSVNKGTFTSFDIVRTEVVRVRVSDTGTVKHTFSAFKKVPAVAV